MRIETTGRRRGDVPRAVTAIAVTALPVHCVPLVRLHCRCCSCLSSHYLCPCDSLQCEIAPPWLSERHGGRRSGRGGLCELVGWVECALRSDRAPVCVRMCVLRVLLSVTVRVLRQLATAAAGVARHSGDGTTQRGTVVHVHAHEYAHTHTQTQMECTRMCVRL